MKQKKVLTVLTIMIFDAIIIFLSYFFSMLITETLGYTEGFPQIGLFLVIIIVIKLLLNLATGVYNIINRYLDYKDIAKIVLVAFGTNALIVIYLSIPGVTKFMPRSVYLFITTLEVFGLVSFRLSRKLIDYYKYIIENRNLVGKRTIIIGAGSAAELAIKEINSNKSLHNTIIGLLDDDDNKITRTISNYKVLGPISSLK